MKRFVKYSLTLWCLVLFAKLTFSQDIKMPYIEAESIYRGEDSIIFAETRSMPPHYLKRFDGYKFEIIMHIKFPDDSIFLDELFGIVYVLQDGTSEKLPITHNNVIRISSKEYEYTFPIKIKNDGWVGMFLAQRSDFSKDENVRFYKNTSNKINLYLSHY